MDKRVRARIHIVSRTHPLLSISLRLIFLDMNLIKSFLIISNVEHCYISIIDSEMKIFSRLN